MKSMVKDYKFADQVGLGAEHDDLRSPKLTFDIDSLWDGVREGAPKIRSYSDAEKVITNKLIELGYDPKNYPKIKFTMVPKDRYGHGTRIKINIPDKISK